jgi:hypothetical protein
VLNAPSPAATSSLSIGLEVAERAMKKLNWQGTEWTQTGLTETELKEIELIHEEARLVLSWHRYIDTPIEQGTTHTRSTEIFTQR